MSEVPDRQHYARYVHVSLKSCIVLECRALEVHRYVYLNKNKTDCTYKVTLRRVRITTVAVEKQ
jgi:hypothetical protein